MRPLHLALAALAAFLPLSARADLFSPGELSRAHAGLEGVRGCESCHPKGGRLSQERCLACHTELKVRVEKGQGFHGLMAQKDRACQSCHHEHQGRDFPLVDWGAAGQKSFAHAKAGWPLRGKHGDLACEKCHLQRRVSDPAVRKVLAEQPGRTTFLGLPRDCASCHFDEHRGQTGADCERCHSEAGFKPPERFDHAKTAFALEGKHASVACDRCHPREEDKATPADAFPPPKARTFLRFKNVAHAACTDCHKDPHGGRLGADCVRCHSPDGWKQVRNLEKERGFHSKTRFPLEGAHASAPCRSCHGEPARYVGLAFGACGDCHPDAHLGQLAAAGKRGPDCGRCHGLDSFKPPRFELEDHQQSRFRLEGSHQAVACGRCHVQDPTLARRVPEATRLELRRKRRPERFSFARFRPAGDGCESCHEDPHSGQLSPRRCAECHREESFTEVRFDHARDSRYPLTGRHAGLACSSCHRPAAAGGPVRYKPLETRCAACHADPHAGQFARDGQDADCARCHSTDGFKPTLFRHQPPFTDFLLQGRHEGVSCEGCHPEVEVGQGSKVRRYSALPRECEGCHEDHHRGAFAALASLAEGPVANADGSSRCAACHRITGWQGATLDHAKTGFPLKGRHQGAACSACHPARFDQPVPSTCAGCHADPHGGELGRRCEGCHDEESWRSRFDADAHRRTSFPLLGRHASLPCQECHLDARDRGFSRAAVECVACHQRDYDRTGLGSFDHRAAGFPTDCRACHDGWRFSPARYLAHDACFQISSGDHAGIRCKGCHTSLPPARGDGSCFTGTAACTRCHACGQTDRRHDEVGGYQCKDRKCYECHRFTVDD